MKKSMFLMCLVTILVASMSIKAQEVTVTLNPGWTWISCPTTDTVDFATALGDFTPMQGDIIKSQWGASTYLDNRWRGAISQFYAGYGYHYYSNRAESVQLTMGTPLPQLSVTTAEPTDITATSALVGSIVTIGEGNHIFVRGVCWGTEQMPNVDGDHISGDAITGSQSYTLSGLEPATAYYVRAYAVTDYGLVYGNETSFTTSLLPSYTVTVFSNPVEGGTITGAGTYEQGQSCTLTATANEDYSFINWTENGSVVSTNATYSFTVDADRTLVVNFTYNGSGNVPTGAINGLFSVSGSRQVYFSHGNLQYQASTNTWRFAEHQYDYIGNANINISSTYSGWIDLFGWATSGYHDSNDENNVRYRPWSTATSTVNTDYNYYGYGPSTNMASPNLTGNSVNYDWGVYNPISNGGNIANQWRVLTKSEWNYVFNTRTTASGIRYAKAKVNNVNGVILLPDDWSSNFFELSNTNTASASYNSNNISNTQWTTIFESAGAVFLPAAGIRGGKSTVNAVGQDAFYWSSTHSSSYNSYALYFYDTVLYTKGYFRYYGLSVRLVRTY